MVVDSHSLLGVPHTENGHVEDGGEEDDDEDSKGHHKGGLGQCHQIRRSAKLARVRSVNTEAAPVDIEDTS